jgi:hypothetical protein
VREADSGEVARPDPGHLLAHGGHAPDDFVPRHHRVKPVVPLVTCLVQIEVANSAVLIMVFVVGVLALTVNFPCNFGLHNQIRRIRT